MKDEEASTSKVAPAKKPKAKKAKPTGDGEETADSTKTKAKKTKESKPELVILDCFYIVYQINLNF